VVFRGSLGFTVLICFMTGSEILAQQNTLMTQYMFNNFAFNPASAGSSEGINATGWLRQQWIGFKDDEGNKIAPVTYYVSVDAPIRILRGGAGLSIYSDQLGFFRNIGLNLGYAYRMDLGPGDFSAGITLDVLNTRIDFAKFKPIDEDDPLLNDKSEKSDLVVDFSLGAGYRIPDRFYVSVSATQIAQTKAKKLYYQLKRHYYLTAGYNWPIPGHPMFEIQPSVLVQTDGAAFQFDIDALLIYNKKFWGGIGYRYQDAVSVLAGVNIKGLRVGVSYDISTSELTHYNSGSVEVFISYLFKLKVEKYRKSYRNTRFL